MDDAPRWKRRPNEADDGTMANAYDMHDTNTTNARTTARLRIAINEQDMISLSRIWLMMAV